MGWRNVLQKAADWGMEAVKEVSYFAYQVVARGMVQVSATPSVIYSSVTNQAVRTVNNHHLYIILYDVFLPAVGMYALSLLEEALRSLEDEENQDWISTNTALTASIALLQAASYVFIVRNELNYRVHKAVLELEAPKKLIVHPYYNICAIKKCSTSKFLKASFNDAISYMLMQGFVIPMLFGHIPLIGKTLTYWLKAYNTGRFAVLLAQPYLCSEHGTYYTQEYSAESAAAGGTHALAVEYALYYIETSTGIPRRYYETAVYNFLLMQQVALLTHSNMPKAVAAPTHGNRDPIYLTQYIINKLLAGLFISIHRIFKDLFKQEKSTFPWGEVANVAYRVWTNPVLQGTRKIVLPKMFHSSEDMRHDPLVQRNWESLRRRLILILTIILAKRQKISTNVVLAGAAQAPKLTSAAVHRVWGLPKLLVQLVILLMNNPNFVNKLYLLKEELELMSDQEPVDVKESELAVRLRQPEEEEKEAVEKVEEEVIDTGREALLQLVVSKPGNTFNIHERGKRGAPMFFSSGEGSSNKGKSMRLAL